MVIIPPKNRAWLKPRVQAGPAVKTRLTCILETTAALSGVLAPDPDRQQRQEEKEGGQEMNQPPVILQQQGAGKKGDHAADIDQAAENGLDPHFLVLGGVGRGVMEPGDKGEAGAQPVSNRMARRKE